MKSKISILLIIVIIMSIFSGCTQKPEYYQYSYYINNIYANYSFSSKSYRTDDSGKKVLLSESDFKDIISNSNNKIKEYFDILEKNEEQINSNNKYIFDLNSNIIEYLNNLFDISKNTEGEFDPTLGFIKDSLENSSNINIEDITNHIGIDKINININDNLIYKTDENTKLDLSALEDDFVLNNIVELLNESDILYGTVSIGQSFGIINKKNFKSKFKVGITNYTNNSIIGYYYMNNGYMASVGSEDKIIDKTTCDYVNNDIECVYVFANQPYIAKALSISFYNMGKDELLDFYSKNIYSFEAILINKNGDIIKTAGISKNNSTFKN